MEIYGVFGHNGRIKSGHILIISEENLGSGSSDNVGFRLIITVEKTQLSTALTG